MGELLLGHADRCAPSQLLRCFARGRVHTHPMRSESGRKPTRAWSRACQLSGTSAPSLVRVQKPGTSAPMRSGRRQGFSAWGTISAYEDHDGSRYGRCSYREAPGIAASHCAATLVADVSLASSIATPSSKRCAMNGRTASGDAPPRVHAEARRIRTVVRLAKRFIHIAELSRDFGSKPLRTSLARPRGQARTRLT